MGSDCLAMASASRTRGEVGVANQGHKIARHEMCYFCFDVLYCHLYNLQPPQQPTTFSNKKTATFLPEVPLAQGWDKIQTIDSLLRKGGWRGQVTPEVRSQIRLVRYQSELVSVTYQDYLQHCRQ